MSACRRRFAAAAAAIVLATLAACSNTAPPARDAASPPAPGASAASPSGTGGTAASGAGPASGSTRSSIDKPHARWVAAAWSDLPGWGLDRPSELVPALLRSCEHPAPGWAAACAEARRDGIAGWRDHAVGFWLETHLQPWRVESVDGSALGLATGYFEPLVDASRSSRPGFRVPLYAPPPDLATKKPYWTRRQIDTLPAARASLRGSEVAWLHDPLDALLLQVQGSGRLRFVDPHGAAAPTVVRVAYAAHNDQPYKSVGRWLVEQGALTVEQASWPAIRAWARQNPGRLDELLWSNPRVVFFREEPLPDPSVGPKGAQGVPLTPGRSVAVDPLSVPYGTPAWIDTSEPLSTTPLRRLVMAQDTGTAISGAVRVDYFWGWGEAAENQAGRMKQPLRLWVLWPR